MASRCAVNRIRTGLVGVATEWRLTIEITTGTAPMSTKHEMPHMVWGRDCWHSAKSASGSQTNGRIYRLLLQDSGKWFSWGWRLLDSEEGSERSDGPFSLSGQQTWHSHLAVHPLCYGAIRSPRRWCFHHFQFRTRQFSLLVSNPKHLSYFHPATCNKQFCLPPSLNIFIYAPYINLWLSLPLICHSTPS